MRAHTTGPHRQEPGAKNGLVASAANPPPPDDSEYSEETVASCHSSRLTHAPITRRAAGSSGPWRACRVRPEGNRSPPRPRSSPAHPPQDLSHAQSNGMRAMPHEMVTDRERRGVRVLVRLGWVEGLVVGVGVRGARGLVLESSSSSKEDVDLLICSLPPQPSSVREQQDRAGKQATPPHPTCTTACTGSWRRSRSSRSTWSA